MSDLEVWRRMMGAKYRADGKKLTQKQAAKMLDISPVSWVKYEHEGAPLSIRFAMSSLLQGLPPYGYRPTPKSKGA